MRLAMLALTAASFFFCKFPLQRAEISRAVVVLTEQSCSSS